MDLSKIKLIIWDLDETLWQGVLSDGTVVVSDERMALIRNITDCGVVNSVCSKNDMEQTQKFLQQLGIWELIVFCSINWSPKGERVRQIVDEMGLRYVNVLFIDDNPLNLEEAKNACEGIMTATPDIISELTQYFEAAPKKDAEHTRLEQYKVLEKKRDFKALSASNEEFLRDCNIRVDIKYDCKEKADRISELVLRSNQLNFTKIRSSAEELFALFEDKRVKCGYVDVCDNFGDYGTVGFFAVRENTCEHFVFSCRTLNMGVEQYVYNVLGRPALTPVGECASSPFDGIPDWINKNMPTNTNAKKQLSGGKILFKGPCDLSIVFSFIKDSGNVIKEFVYVNDRGVSIESGNHTSHIVQSQTLDDETKKRLSELPFGDADMYKTAMFEEDITAVYLSLFTDPNLGLYREKQSGAVVAFGEWTNDLTDEKNVDGFISGELFTSGCIFTKENLAYIKENFDFIGRITPEQTVANLEKIHSRLAKNTKLILNLGSELEHIANTQPAYEGRHIYHKELGDAVRQWSSTKKNVYLIDATELVSSQSDYTNNINHFEKKVYYKMAQKLTQILCDDSLKVRRIQKIKFTKRIKKFLKRILKKM